MAQLPTQGDRFTAALQCLVRITEQPEGNCPEGSARHSGVQPGEEGVASVSFRVVQRNRLLHVFARGGWVAEAEGSDRQGVVGLEEQSRIFGGLRSVKSRSANSRDFPSSQRTS